MQESPLLHKPEQAAKRLSVGRSTVFELMRSGKLESVKVGRARRVPEAALVAFVDQLRSERLAA